MPVVKSPSARTSAATADLNAALAQLYRRNLHVVKLGLEAERALLDRLGHPENTFLSIHVAGTNGKGSVCSMIASVLQAAGLRTGLYTSPHLVRFNERVRVNGDPMADGDLARLMRRVEDAAGACVADGGRDVTFFEFTTAIAFEHFRESKVQIAVLETGMGGRLDATNVVTPIVSVITSIGFDHVQYLGNTVESIATEKAGIIKEGRPVICGDIRGPGMDVIRGIARERGASLIPAAQVCSIRRTAQSYDGQRLAIELGDEAISRVNLPLIGEHQLANCALAVGALVKFREETRLPVTAEAIRSGLGSVRWPARCHVVEQDPPVILDGAHNVEAVRALVSTMDELGGARALGLIVSLLADKDAVGFLRELAGRAKRCWIVPIHSERAMAVADIVAAARAVGLDPIECDGLASALDAARAWAGEHRGVVCVTGSLYLAGEALTLLGAPV